jgi:acetyl-CoA acetyltransferase
METRDPVVICAAMRTPLGRFGGELSALTAVSLAALRSAPQWSALESGPST